MTVPDVVGTTSSEATATLDGVGLQANVVSVPSSEPSGTVVAQSPAAGQEARSGDTVRVNVAKAPTADDDRADHDDPAPDDDGGARARDGAGRRRRVARRRGGRLRRGGAEGRRRLRAVDEPQGQVVAQAQPGGTEVERGDTVQLNVSVGADPAEAASVPNVTGRRLNEARQVLSSAGFEVLALDRSGDDVSNSSPIASQSPAGGASIPAGSLVVLYV